jgi:hypothetical protein
MMTVRLDTAHTVSNFARNFSRKFSDAPSRSGLSLSGITFLAEWNFGRFLELSGLSDGGNVPVWSTFNLPF